MTHDPVATALKYHAHLWTIYGPMVDHALMVKHPIAFVAQVRNELDAQGVAAALRSVHYEVLEVAKKWWPLSRRWRIVGLTEPMPFTRESTEQWVASTAKLLAEYTGVLGHWHPAEKPAA